MPYEHTQSASPTSKAYLPIEDYGVIGDLYTAALVGKNGSIDWCCIPDFDSPSVFGAILDAAKGGFFRIAPVETPGMDLKQMYFPNTNVLITRFLTSDGVHDMTEIVLDYLKGYRGSRPVRIGNGAYTQKQLDVYGEVMDALSIYNHDMSHTNWVHVCQQLDWLSTNWQGTDEGIWEVRGGDQHFVHSRVMSWVAFDRALRIARDRGFPAPEDAWTATRAQIYNEIMDKGWSEEKQSFVQYYGGDAIDASTLLISLTRFTGAADPRMLSTIDRIQRELTRPPHVYRYNVAAAASDGLAGEEGTFSICSLWLVEALARAGRVEEAELALEQMLTYTNHVGLYAEEIGPSGEALGNFPQAFTHLSLIEACYSVDKALNKALYRQDYPEQDVF